MRLTDAPPPQWQRGGKRDVKRERGGNREVEKKNLNHYYVPDGRRTTQARIHRLLVLYGLHLKSRIIPNVEHCCHIWAGAAQSSMLSIDRVQNPLLRILGKVLFSIL